MVVALVVGVPAVEAVTETDNVHVVVRFYVGNAALFTPHATGRPSQSPDSRQQLSTNWLAISGALFTILLQQLQVSKMDVIKARTMSLQPL